MKRIYYILFFLSFLIAGCQLRLSKDDSADHAIVIERYDRLEYRYLTTGDYSALQEMNTEYPIETRTLIEDVIKIGDATAPDINSRFLKFYQDTTLQSLIADVEAEYANMDDLNQQLTNAFSRLKHSLPNISVPMIYAQISALDQSVVVGNGAIGISLDKYLGADYPLYKKYYTEQQRQQMTREYILPDCLSFFLMGLYPLQNFENRPQMERDLHMGKIQWIVNQALSHHFYRTKYVEVVSKYMKEHPKTSYEELLKLTNFACFGIEQ
ncbi:gliding motility protein GldB [Prevotella brunnea]|uniref:Gliding motility protein GldB n=1 Tax=Prevotella brunnea TaxID=2508867 RepID=A0A5C8GAR0_9BACT|nr:gliding motility protein GldB [Prevotella brunnea]MDR0186711.1 gliding motility protein GldB [Prevotella brunnea]TXJ59062.1 gliding motility protein GldB [Prevotella brunnea]